VATDTIATLVQAVSERLMARSAPPSGPPACYLFRVVGEGGGELHIVVDRGYARTGVGRPTTPVDCTIELTFKDAEGIVRGRVNPAMAYLTGRIRVSGDMGAAGRLGDLLR
jgi:tRNA A37 threonylcarbamoyladenosine synthetase subunit TsaC/SUA5/YrdC